MSEVVVDQKPHESPEEKYNNNNNTNTNNNEATIHQTVYNSNEYDEIGEEFNFNESDLEEEFEDCSSVAHSNHSDNDRFAVATTKSPGVLPTTTPPTTTTATNSITKAAATESGTSLDDVIVKNVNKTKYQNNDEPNRNVALNPTVVSSENEHLVGNDDDDDDYYSDDPEDELIVQFLGEANLIAEARLSARRQARIEARQIRTLELERQRKAQEHNADRVFDMHTTPALEPLSRTRLANGRRASTMSSHRSSEDSLEEEGRHFADPKEELKDAEERFRKAMVANAQLDNERASQSYQIQHLKDQLEEIGEANMQLQRELKEKSRDCNRKQRNLDKLSDELKLVQGQLSERDALIAEQGLVIVAVENDDATDAKRTLISAENVQLLSSVQGSLDVRLKRFNDEKQTLSEEIYRLKSELEEKKSSDTEALRNKDLVQSSEECEESEVYKANTIISGYKFRLQKAEQDICHLETNLAQSETQLLQYKSAVEAAETAEAELKGERRKLQRESVEATERFEELEISYNHLLQRLEQLKNAEGALLKDL